jgi:hypothetical protein
VFINNFYIICICQNDLSFFLGKSGVALLYLFIGEESKRNGGLLTENPEDDLNKIDFEGKGIRS